MVSNVDFDGKATNLNLFYLHINFGQKYIKTAIVKMRGGRWSKNVCFCPRSGYKNCPRRGEGQKVARFCPRSYRMTPKKMAVFLSPEQIL